MLDRNANGGSILLYIRENILFTLLNIDMSIESSYIEIRFLACTYNPIKNFISNRLKEIGENLDNYSFVTLETRLSDFYKMT